MKDRTKLWTLLFAAVGMLVLILDAETALRGAVDGMEICVKTVIPSLFPFFFLSNLLNGSLSAGKSAILSVPGKWLRLPDGSESVLLSGFLAGYPAGAHAAAQLYRAGCISRPEALRMSAFCSNAGPAFLFGIAGRLFPQAAMAWLLWAIHIVSAILVSQIIPPTGHTAQPYKPRNGMTPAEAMNSAIRSMASVCGWVVLFRIVLSFGERWFFFFLPGTAESIISGILELSNGCIALSQVECVGLRFVLCSAFLGFGGLCVAMQTASAMGDLGLGLYLPGKCTQAGFSLLTAAAVQLLFPAQYRWTPHPAAILGGICLLLPLILRSAKKGSSILQPIGV